MPKTGLVAVVALAISAALIAYLGFFSTGDNLPVEFPTKLQNRVLINEHGTGTVDYYPDGMTPKESVIFHEDGSKTTQWYRLSGTLKEVKTEMPTESGGWTLLRHAYMDTDGVTFISNREFYKNGGLKKDLYVTVDGTTAKRDYYPDGILESEKILENNANNWNVVRADSYREDKSLASRVRTDDNGNKTTELFNADSILVQSTWVNKWQWSAKRKDFRDDGKTVHEELIQDNNESHLYVYRPDGTKRLHVHYTAEIGVSTIWITFYARDGETKTRFQWWEKRSEGYVLWSFKQFDKDENVIHQTILQQDGVTLSSQTRPLTEKGLNGERIVKVYREDGTLEKIRRLTEKSEEISLELFEQSEGITGTYSTELAEMPDFNVPEQIVEYDPDEDE